MSSELQEKLKVFDLTKVQHILAYPIFGNAMSDAPLMDAIDTYVHDTSNTDKDKALVLQHMQIYVMGIPLEDDQLKLTDEQNVQEYLAGC